MSESSLQAIDVTGPTLEDAIEEGLQKLGLTRNDVIIEIVEEGTRGVLGLGAREARVRLTPLRTAPPPPVSQPPSTRKDIETQRSADQPSAPAWTGDVEPDREALTAKDILEELLQKMHVPATIQ